jgi:hypothetical protein
MGEFAAPINVWIEFPAGIELAGSGVAHFRRRLTILPD